MGHAAAEGNIGNLDEPRGPPRERPEDPSARVKNTCPEGTTLLAKYTVDDSGGFAFETGRDELGIDGTEIGFRNVDTKPSEPSEVLAFQWESGVYDVHSVGVKFGNNVERWTTEGESDGWIDVRDRYQNRDEPVPGISNVIFCIEVHWQLDFGIGPVLTPPNYDDGRKDDLVMAAIGQDPETGQSPQNPSYLGHWGTRVMILGNPDQFDISDGTASVTFTVTGSEPLTVHLASFETPGPFEDDEISSQVLFDSTEVTLDPGIHTLEVSLPSL
jgi:hypothetical protein